MPYFVVTNTGVQKDVENENGIKKNDICLPSVQANK